MCKRCADFDFPMADIWRPCYQPTRPSRSTRHIPTMTMDRCNQDALEPDAHHPQDIAEIAALRTALSIACAKNDALTRARTSYAQKQVDTFVSVMKVANDE